MVVSVVVSIVGGKLVSKRKNFTNLNSIVKGLVIRYIIRLKVA